MIKSTGAHVFFDSSGFLRYVYLYGLPFRQPLFSCSENRAFASIGDWRSFTEKNKEVVS